MNCPHYASQFEMKTNPKSTSPGPKSGDYVMTPRWLSVITTYRFRLYPTKTQGLLMEDALETCRRLYNDLLAETSEKQLNFYQKQPPSLRGKLVTSTSRPSTRRSSRTST
ncbi:MAG: helix-turn-helix domain-containing protein [Thaumarchaeota archaeon]|nr:helix-turn-helix domain-containing protein [Nitrososphaerota archaeon]